MVVWTKFLLIVVVGFLLAQSSCSVEKRLYNKGFHVEWKKNVKSLEEQVVEKSVVSEEEHEEVSDNCDAATSADEVVHNELTDSLSECLMSDSELKSPLKDTVYIYDDQVKYEPVGIASFFTLVGSVASIRILSNVPQYWLVSIALFFAAFVLSIISIVRFYANRGYYEMNPYGWLTFVVTMIGIILFLVLVFSF